MATNNKTIQTTRRNMLELTSHAWLSPCSVVLLAKFVKFEGALLLLSKVILVATCTLLYKFCNFQIINYDIFYYMHAFDCIGYVNIRVRIELYIEINNEHFFKPSVVRDFACSFIP